MTTIQQIYDNLEKLDKYEHLVKTTDGMAVIGDSGHPTRPIVYNITEELAAQLGVRVKVGRARLIATHPHSKVSDATIRVYKATSEKLWFVMNYESNSFGLFVYKPTSEDILG